MGWEALQLWVSTTPKIHSIHTRRFSPGCWSHLQRGGATWDVKIVVQTCRQEESTTGPAGKRGQPSSGAVRGHLQLSQSLGSPFPSDIQWHRHHRAHRGQPWLLQGPRSPWSLIRGDLKPQGHPRAPLTTGFTKRAFAQRVPSGRAWAPCPVGIIEINQ